MVDTTGGRTRWWRKEGEVGVEGRHAGAVVLDGEHGLGDHLDGGGERSARLGGLEREDVRDERGVGGTLECGEVVSPTSIRVYSGAGPCQRAVSIFILTS